jgi:putative membrane protein
MGSRVESNTMDLPDCNDPRVAMAAERTFLAWVRIGVALMGFGFVVARFGNFLREPLATGTVVTHPRHAISAPMGVSLIVLGIGVTVGAAIRDQRYLRGLKEGLLPKLGDPWFAILVAVVLGAIGAILATYLALI